MNYGRMQVPVLFINDSQPDVEWLLRALRKEYIRGDWRRISDPRNLRETLGVFNPAIVIASYPAREFPESAALKIVQEIRPDLPFVIVSDTMTEEQTIQALREGANDVIRHDPGKLTAAVRRVLMRMDKQLAREHARQRLATQYEIASILADGNSLKEAINRIYKTICEREGFVAASMWKVAPDKQALQCVDVWTGSDAKLDTFVEETRGLTIRPGTGVAGRAWSSRLPVWISDLNMLADLPYPARKATLRLGTAFPIIIRSTVKGIMAFWGLEVREEDPELLDMFQAISNQIGQFMDRDEQRDQIIRLNRVHTVLSEINSAIVRVEDRQQLFDAACRIAVEKGNFGIAWVGEYDPVSLDVTPVAWAGLEARDLVGVKSTARPEVPQGQGILGQAIRSKKLAFSNDISAQLGVGGTRRQEAMRRGYRSLIVLPLLLEAEVAGILSLFVMEADFFNNEELRLLSELADNLSFALEHLAKKDRIDYLANRDAVTGIANRNLLNEYLEQALGQAERSGHMLAVAVITIQNFRMFNEALGHNAGDVLLKVIATRIGASIRKTDNIARLGGSDFALVLPLKSDAMAVAKVMDRVASSVFEEAAALETMRRVLDMLSQPVTIEGRELHPKCCMGVALYPQDGADAESLLKNAAAATRAEQLRDQGFQFYTAELNARLSDRLTLQAELRYAIERGEFSLYYQPKLNLLTGAGSGAEGLLRWNKPGADVVLPDRFISLLEETGQIVAVGSWVMEQAVADFRRWREHHPEPPRLAVNVSALQLEQKDFADAVEIILRKFGAGGPVGLDLEITESAIMRDLGVNIEKLKLVRDMGVNIIIDDFGTGYSSLRYLAKLPGNTLKIDRSFVQEMESSQDTLTIVTTIISLAHSLGLKVVAEGVERESQKNTLRLLGCDEIQGYLVSHPLPRSQFEDWWKLQSTAG